VADEGQSAVTGSMSAPSDFLDAYAPVNAGQWAGGFVDAGGLIRPAKDYASALIDSLTFQKEGALNEIAGERNALLGLRASLTSSQSLHSGVNVYQNAEFMGPPAPPEKRSNAPLILGLAILGYFLLKRKKRG